MRKFIALLGFSLLTALVGCVTINVYFPAAAAQKAADQFIGSVIDQNVPAPKDSTPAPPETSSPAQTGGPSAGVLDLLIPPARAAEPDLRIHTPAIDAIHTRMRKRFADSLQALLNDGAVGFTQDGLVALRSISAVPLSQRASVNSVIAAENKDRNQLYADIAKANNHPDWEPRIRQTFAQLWISRAHAGWYYRGGSGAWKRK